MNCLTLAVVMMAVVLTAGTPIISQPEGKALLPEQLEEKALLPELLEGKEFLPEQLEGKALLPEQLEGKEFLPEQLEGKEFLPEKLEGKAVLPGQTKQITLSYAFRGHVCYYTQYTLTYSWGRLYAGDFRCPTWTTIRGFYRSTNSALVFNGAYRDFLRKMAAAGLIG